MGLRNRGKATPQDFNKKGAKFIGKITRETETRGVYAPSICTATMVSESIVLSAAHCVTSIEDRAKFTKGRILFQLGYNELENTKIHETHLKIIKTGSKKTAFYGRASLDFSYDWVLLEMETPYNKIGAMKIADVKDLRDLKDLSLMVAGYGHSFSKGQYITIQDSCSARNEVNKDLYAIDCDTSVGDSGAPIYTCDAAGECTIYGINSGTSVRPQKNISLARLYRETGHPYHFDPKDQDNDKFNRINIIVGAGAFKDAYLDLL